MGQRGKGHVNLRPADPRKRHLTLEQRKERSVAGAQYSPTLDRWIGFLFDGNYTTTFDPRTNRARALRDAQDHKERIFSEERAKVRWKRGGAQAA